MREVRPTIKVLKALPRDTFKDAAVLDQIANEEFAQLRLYGIDHPLLADARARFAAGLPDLHRAATQRQKCQVFEVRAAGGAAWRGAVIRDAEGDPWLVWVERHNQFHRKVASIDLQSLLPTKAELALRDREEAAEHEVEWRRSTLHSFMAVLREAFQTGETASGTLEGLTRESKAELSIESVHTPPTGSLAATSSDGSLVSITARLSSNGYPQLETALISVCLPFLEPDHYVVNEYLLDGFVNAAPVRGVCGVWFVPSRGGLSGLPVCERCEAEQPTAQAVLDLLRRHA